PSLRGTTVISCARPGVLTPNTFPLHVPAYTRRPFPEPNDAMDSGAAGETVTRYSQCRSPPSPLANRPYTSAPVAATANIHCPALLRYWGELTSSTTGPLSPSGRGRAPRTGMVPCLSMLPPFQVAYCTAS